MRTMFRMGFGRDAWDPWLGQGAAQAAVQPSVWSAIEGALKAGASAYESYTKLEIAEEKAETEEEIARIKESSKAAEGAAQAARAQAQAATGAEPGIPTSYLVAGGLGLAAVVATIALVA